MNYKSLKKLSDSIEQRVKETRPASHSKKTTNIKEGDTILRKKLTS